MSRPSLRLLALCAVVVLALPLAGCGSNDTKTSNQYVSEVNAIQNEVATQFRQAGTAISPTSSIEADKEALKQFDAAVTTAVAKLKAVKTPDKVKTLHADLVREVDGYHESIAAARRALSATNQKAVAAAQAKFASGTAQTSASITTTIDQINSKLHS